MSLKQQYCIVTQEEAYEARELLVKAGEPISNIKPVIESDFEVVDSDGYLYLQYHDFLDKWYVGSVIGMDSRTPLTYPQFKKMLNAKIKEK